MPHEATCRSLLEGLPVWVNDADNVWPTLQIANSIPLSRLEWLWNSRGTSIRDSSTSARAVFDVSTVKNSIFPDPQQHPLDWYKNPYVYTFVTSLRDLVSSNDAAWKRIRRFVEKCKDNHHEYLVILAATEEDLAKKKKILEKLRTEVNLTARGRERFVVVPPAAIQEEQRPITHLHHSPAHQDLLVRLRECVREGAEARVQAYEEEVSRSYLNRTSATWTFTGFFALKEGMAFIFVQLGRRDLAVRFYDELQVTMTERNEYGTGSFCGEPAAETAAGVSDPTAKDYRARLVANSISEIDLRTYLFSRQLSLLLMDRKFADVAERGLKFVTAIARRCAEETLSGNGRVSAVFRDTWVFVTARALAAALAPAIPSPCDADNATAVHLSTPRERHTARLIAGFHVHALKAFLGLASVTLPGCLGPEDPQGKRDREKIAEEAKSTSHERLRAALADPKKAEVFHSEITNAAASLYEMGGRARGAAALDGDAGVVRLRNASYSEAESLLSAQCTRFINDNGWDDLHKRQRVELARAEKELDHIQEYLVSCLTMLYMSRSERHVWSKPLEPTKEMGWDPKDVAYWVSETTSIAQRLPRIMKYKAERLFDVSVLPNKTMWLEGDPGSATIRITSDIPAKLKLDSIALECRSAVSAPVRMKKPALRSDEKASIPSQHSGDTALGYGGQQNLGVDGEDNDLVVLRSNESMYIESGVNVITVQTGEIPMFGRYNSTLLSLFIGNLKLVESPGKGSAIPVVSTKGATGGKNMPGQGFTIGQSDSVTGDVKFPMFYAEPRQPSAYVSVEGRGALHLAPGSVQFLRVKITAGPHGLAEGSKLRCSLSSLRKGSATDSSGFVEFLDIGTSINAPSGESDLAVLQLKRLSEESHPRFDIGETSIHESLQKGEVLESWLALKIVSDCSEYQDRSLEDDADSRACILRVQVHCAEKDSTAKRKFVCRTEKSLTFTCPVRVSARIELNCEWSGEAVSRALGLDGTPLRDGGTLLCTLRNVTKSESAISILKATLESPPWLELRPDEKPPHVSLLPCTVQHDSVFAFAFDVQIREELPDERESRDITGTVAPAFSDDALQRRLSRAVVTSSEMKDSQQYAGEWNIGNKVTTELRMHDATALDDAKTSKVKALIENPEIDSDFGDDVVERSITELEGSMFSEHEHRDSTIVPENEDCSFDGQMVRIGVEEDESIDLSPPQGAAIQSPAHPLGFAEAVSFATLRLDLMIEGVDSETTIERHICMDAMQRTEKRYRVERSVKKVGKCGKEMEMQFSVGTIMGGGSPSISSDAFYDEAQNSDDVELLQYEIDADPTIWLVVGRRRGRLEVSNSLTTVECAKLIPLAPGRRRVPLVRLFTADGRGLAFSRYENVNEYMQVVVVPQQTVVSACSVDSAGDNNPHVPHGAGSMPAVVASDSYFRN